MSFLEVFFLALIEGLTEFLPVSSTGHLIVLAALFGIEEDGFVKAFNIIIQFGAIMAVVLLYWRRFLPIRWEFYKKLAVAVMPALIAGFLMKNKIDEFLENSTLVAVTFILGGFVLIWSDRKFKDDSTNSLEIDSLTLRQCFYIGLIQCTALIPGVSRSGATIIGGLFLGMTRKAAAEFSFFLAVPTLTAAAAYKSAKIYHTIDTTQLQDLVLGLVLSFVFAMIAVKFMIGIVSKFGFRHFGYYRILVGLLIFYVAFRGVA